MDKRWTAVNFETFQGGVSSAVPPDLLPINQTAWGINLDLRGSKPSTRPNFHCRLIMPSGLFQGIGYFSVQGGMLVASIGGNLYRIRIGARDYSFEPIILPFRNSGILKEVWMQQTVETLIIQDGQSNPIFYNGSTARRSTSGEVPLGKMMAYGNGRLWVAVGERQLLAGDIRQSTPGSELKFTETTYLFGGGSLYFSEGIAGLAFNAVTGTTDYGTLMVYSADRTVSIRADITSRDDWQTYPGFVTNALRSIGAAGHRSIVEVNQDLYWRDSNGGIRSLRSSLVDESGPGSAPISREVSRLVEHDSQQLLKFCSSIYFDNRLLMTSSPYLNTQGGVSFKDLVSLDFAPISTMQGKSSPAYNGQWNGVEWSQLVSGKFDGRNRAFGVSADSDGINRLWEFDTRNRDDIYISCGSNGSGWPITAAIEYPSVDFANPKGRKRLERCDVWLKDISGELEFKVYWRSDNNQKWTQWDEAAVCARVTDPSRSAPHQWKNLLSEQRPQIKSFSIPDGIDEITHYALDVGFEFQIRVVWQGKCTIDRVMIHAIALDQTDYADREDLTAECVQNNVSDNEVAYKIPISAGCAEIQLADAIGGNIAYNSNYAFGSVDLNAPLIRNFTIQNVGGGRLDLGDLQLIPNSGFSVFAQPTDPFLLPGETTTFSLRMSATVAGPKSATVLIPNNSLTHPVFQFNVAGTVYGGLVSLGYASKAGNVTYQGFIEMRYLPNGESVGTYGNNGSQAAWSSIDTYDTGRRQYYSGKFYESILQSVNKPPSSNPTYWKEVDPITYWLTSSLTGTGYGCSYNATTNCVGQNFTGRLPDRDFSGSATVTHTGTYDPSGYSALDWNNTSVFPGPCLRNGTSSLFTGGGVIGLIGGVSSDGTATKTQRFFGNDACAASSSNSSATFSTIVRTLSNQEDPGNYLTPNGAQVSSKAGVWSAVNIQTGAQQSTASFAITYLRPSTQYTLTINFSADIGAAPATSIQTFMSNGSGVANLTAIIPFGVVGSTVSISSYSIDAV